MTIHRVNLTVAAIAIGSLMAGMERLHAQVTCDLIEPAPSSRTTFSAGPHPAPLDRRVTVHESNVSLRTALDQLSAETGVRLSYSSDAIELDHRVCLELGDVPLGDLLAVLLAGSGLEPRAMSSDHIALVPIPAERSVEAAPTDSAQAIPLDSVHLQVERNAGPARTPGGSVITREQLAAYPTSKLAALLNGTVPAFWAWAADGSGLNVQLGSMRGAASFSGSVPKVYLDGIELANPLTLARLSPETIDDVEVISGPQGAALYGPNATGGVVNIRTRQGSPSADRPQLRLRGELGLSTGSAGTPLRGEQAVGLDIGNERASARLDVSAGFGEGGHETLRDGTPRRFEADLAGRLVGERSVVTLTARYLEDESAVDVAATGHRGLSTFGVPEISVRETIFGMTAALRPEGRWTHTLTAGIDAYAVERPTQSLAAPGTPQLDVTAGERTTLRLSSAGQFDLGRDSHALVRFVADHSLLRERSGGDVPASGTVADRTLLGRFVPSARASEPTHTRAASPTEPDSDRTTGNAGLGIRTELVLRERLSVHGGLRFDRFGRLFEAGPWVAQPMLGASWTTGARPVALTLRAAYGRAIRQQDHPTGTIYDMSSTDSPFEPTFERQSGIEAGVDVELGPSFSLSLTRFDQTASALSQRVEVAVQDVADAAAPPYRGNVGEIDNTGWELQGTLRQGAFSLHGTLSLVDSRVARTALNYEGELRPGDRMLNVPARVAGLTASWNTRKWSALLTASQAAGWIGYDRAMVAGSAEAPPRGAELRDFWREYNRITMLAASGHWTMRSGLDVTVSLQNLLNARLEGADPWMAFAGRTATLGFRFSF